MVAMVASGYGTLRRFLSAPEGQHSANEAGVASSASVAVSSKQRASIKWLLSKAFNNRVPENLQEPFYRDHEDLEHLKPPICGGLANAELYCLALANMYSDPNYHSLNHWNILQTLVRKGIDVPDPPDCALTETVLIQTNPLKMGAHMVVIEALMKLYAREVVTADRVWAAAQRFGATLPPINSASTHEAGILCWVNAACAAFNKAEESTPPVPTVSSLQDLCEGTSLAALVSFYCPEALPRSALRVGRVASIQDCLHNLMLVHDFCANYLPHNIFHMMPEDVTYMRGSMKQNLVAMLADLFNVLEVHPVKSVKCPGSGAASQFGPVETEQTDRRKTTTFSTPPLNTTTWQQQFLQQENQLNGEEGAGEGGAGGGGAMAAQLNNIRLKLEEKRRRIELDKRRAEQALSRQRQQLGHQAFLQAVTRDAYLKYQLASLGKGARTPPEDEPKQEPALTQDMVVEPPSQSVDNVVLEQYQQSIAKMNSSLQDIQSDIARLANQQNQLQHQQHQQHQHQQAKQLFQQQPQPQLVPQSQPPPSPAPYQQHYQPNIPQLHSQFSSQHNVARSPLSGFGSTPHLPRDLRDQREMWDQRDQRDLRDVRDQYYPAQYRDMDEYSRQQFYLHDSPPPPQRRTWAQHAQHQHEQEHRGWQLHQQSQPQYQREPEPRTWRSPSPSASPQPPVERSWTPQGFTQPFHVHYSQQNGNDTQNHLSYVVSEQQHQHHTHQQHSHQQQQPLKPQQLHQRQASPAPPPPDDMQPQNISFIGNAEDDALRHGIARLNISSGTRTYRIPSPTRPTLARNSFQQEELPENEKGFYISFDNEQPKRAKPPLRPKRMSPKKERSSEAPSPERGPGAAWGDRVPAHEEPCVPRRAPSPSPERARPSSPQPAAALLIGEMNPDPNSAEEMERKKERIMLLSLQRRQRADEARARAEAAAAARRSREDAAQELKQARKEEQARRREAILQQYKLKKAIEEAEREGKVIDKSELLESMKHGSSPASSNPRLRSRGATTRARPKTIHVDTGALHAAEGMLAKQPSATNLAAGGGSVRRDYYRGSQDSLAERAGLYRDSPVDDRGGMSPSSASSGPLGRRGSCKTSRERVNEEPQSSRGRSKYTSYQSNFKAGRKSSSLMNLCDSGLGRATPPRRAASPAHRTAASGPGSLPGALPGAIGKRRQHDDNSDVSSTHSSIMDYSARSSRVRRSVKGPRLYKQPTTKSNRGIMLNAVEYCVFPGAVNAEAKRRVLDEVARSESKHFLVLFRDAGCQFRALYSYCPETDLIAKLYGTGPKVVNDRMFDKFFKYNSGSKCFSQVHTKHLTVTIDAFTIHNSLWQGKKVQLPSKKDMALVI
ncbi:patronin isoform X15 [Bombyx mandarina]|uniref:Patronin isoform X15 n=1 Tax=Bombyx mandarina TaxID=7092 RepID=A0A6J2K378_BOMMA|nr:patronin isoform X15 [Bombyx mandarina]